MNTGTAIALVLVVVLVIAAGFFLFTWNGPLSTRQKPPRILGEPGYVAPAADPAPAGFSSSSVSVVT